MRDEKSLFVAILKTLISVWVFGWTGYYAVSMPDDAWWWGVWSIGMLPFAVLYLKELVEVMSVKFKGRLRAEVE